MIRLGNAWVSLERREAFHEDAPVRLGSRAFDVLEALLAAPNRLVTKDELIRSIWPDTVVEENNLQVHVSTLRKALGLDRQMLETIPGRGYRLNLAQITRVSVGTEANAADAYPPGEELPKVHVHVVDDEPAVRAALVRQLRSAGISAIGHESAEAFLGHCDFTLPGCLLLDVRLSQGSGFDLQAELIRREAPLPIVFMTGFGTIDMSVRAIKAGAEGFLTKPFDERQLLGNVHEAMRQAAARHAESRRLAAARERYAGLTPREQEVFLLLLEGCMNKEIAARLGLQEVTVKVHKKHIMTKLGTRTLVDLLLVGKMLGRLPEPHQRSDPQA
ncbi:MULTISPECIES: response regulator [Pseudomonas]|uniref:response regulator n=1 Tax=Pseudomonas TaxID=286 RepID=UPI000DAA34BF|nr:MULTISPECIES: response regulator [Pseudomonas]MDW3711074.1 response regulator [Pseudomonas sp. 2023EL-01195]PZE11819.1 LuxR family transcriptional regulator [Pseudomonas sp. 57B-090624]